MLSGFEFRAWLKNDKVMVKVHSINFDERFITVIFPDEDPNQPSAEEVFVDNDKMYVLLSEPVPKWSRISITYSYER
jgi:hypothetical protein